MTNIIKKFNSALRWNAFESIFYKAILFTHQACLFYFADRLVYGFSSLLFAIIYLTVELINLGFDYSCAQLSANYFGYRSDFKSYFIPQAILQAVIWITLLLFVLANYQLINNKLLPPIAFLTKQQWLLLAFIAACESLRKTLRIIAQLLFLNKRAAILESFLILIYVFLFWTAIAFGCPIDIHTIYLPLLIQSILGIFCLIYFIIPILKLKLQTQPSEKSPTYLQIASIRTQNYLYQLSELLFSSNFLIYFLSSFTGLLAIGPVKLANYLAVFIKALLDRTFGLASLAIFVQNKHFISSQKAFFVTTQRKLNLTLIIILLFFVIGILGTNFAISNSSLALLFFGLTLVNNFLIVYEQLFLVYNQILILFLLNLFSIILCSVFIYTYPQVTASCLIVSFIFLRIATLLIVKLISRHFFKPPQF